MRCRAKLCVLPTKRTDMTTTGLVELRESGVVPRGNASVSVDACARPDRGTHVRLETFDGPLALLLSLIEQRQLDVLEVPLGELAGAYLEALSELRDARLPHLSAFISVCSQLILIKSRAILPRPPAMAAKDPDVDHDPEAELRARLILYKRYRDAADGLALRLKGDLSMAHREAGVAQAAGLAGARPAEATPLDPTLLAAALSASLRLVPPPAAPAEVMPRMVTLAERSAIIRSALRRAPVFVLQDLLHEVRDRVVVAVTFLAMLELVKTRELSVEQAQPWGPIICRVVVAPARADAAE